MSNLKVYNIKSMYKADGVEETELNDLIVAESKEEALAAIKENFRITADFQSKFYYEDFEPTNEQINVISAEEFDHIIMNEPTIFSEIPLGRGGYHTTRMGNWGEILEGITYDEDGYARFRKMYIQTPNAGEVEFVLHYDSKYDNPNNKIINRMISQGRNPWGV